MKVLKLYAAGRAVLADMPDDFEAMQEFVGGKIDLSAQTGYHVLSDLDAWRRDKPENAIASKLAGRTIQGDALVCGTRGYRFCDLSDKALAVIEDVIRVNFMRVVEVEKGVN